MSHKPFNRIDLPPYEDYTTLEKTNFCGGVRTSLFSVLTHLLTRSTGGQLVLVEITRVTPRSIASADCFVCVCLPIVSLYGGLAHMSNLLYLCLHRNGMAAVHQVGEYCLEKPPENAGDYIYCRYSLQSPCLLSQTIELPMVLWVPRCCWSLIS